MMANTIAHGQKQQRARQQLSCTACRAGKLKCDRQQPCDQCHKRAREDACHYLPPPQKKKQNRNTKDRIAQLEGLVVKLMNRDGANDASSVTPPISDDGSLTKPSPLSENSQSLRSVSSKESPQSEDSADSTAQDLTYLKINRDGQSSFRGGSHWEAILESIAELRDTFDNGDNGDDDDDAQKEQHSIHFTRTVITGVPPTVTRSVLISSLPPKYIADRLLWHWFNSADPGLPVIHQPTFLALYDTLWVDFSKVPTVWLALLYLILSLGAKIALGTLANERRETFYQNLDPDKLHQLGASALALADYTKPQRYVIEALMALVSCEYMNVGRGHSIWLILSFIIRLALRMGYHRDADNFPNLSVFDGEMRRRIWNILYTFDVLHSYQEGMPSMVQQIHSDTKTPSNLLDTDFGPETQELPQPRPLAQLSPMSYRLVKNRLSKVFARACDMSNMTQPPDYVEVLKLEKEIQEVQADIPQGLRFYSMRQAILDPPNLIFNRFKLELLFHKTRCVLHRRYVVQIEVGNPQEQSRKLCVDAAIRILNHHEAISTACQDGGQLSSLRYYVASLNSADFLLAAMVLCLELHLISLAPLPTLAGPNQNRVDEMRSLLQSSYNIWKQPVSHFGDTEKAAKAMEAILNKALGSAKKPVVATPATGYDFGSEVGSMSNDGQDNALLDSFGKVQNTNSRDLEPISGMLQENEDIGNLNWATWDKMMLRYQDPNHVPLQYNDPNMWPSDLGSFDFEGMTGISINNLGSNLGNTMTLDSWPTEWPSESAADFDPKTSFNHVIGTEATTI